MFDLSVESVEFRLDRFQNLTSSKFSGRLFRIAKRGFDLFLAVSLLPLLAVNSVVIFVLNPFLNAGPLLFIQDRMGRDCKPFPTIKFRTMEPAEVMTRTAEAPLEINRITKLGRILRKMRIDELPQIINVIRGEMSFIGPRPDYYEHACYFLKEVPGYRERHVVRPGMSGLAQTVVGYVEGSEATKKKVQADLYYITNANLRLELWLIWRTIVVVFAKAGA